MPYKYHPPAIDTPGNIRRDLQLEFSRWNQQAGEQVVTDHDLPYQDGKLRAATVQFRLRGQTIAMTIDEWTDFRVNLKCLYLNIRDMRLAEARGGLEGMREALAMLPPPVRERDPYEVLGVRPDADFEDIQAMFRIKAQRLHSDHGGDDKAMAELNAAMDRIKFLRRAS